jgi:putative protease
LKVSLEGQVMLPMSELNRLRREAVTRLLELRRQPPAWRTSSAEVRAGANQAEPARPAPRNPVLVPLVRDQSQLQAVLDAGFQTVYCDFEDPKKYREAVAAFRKAVPATSASGNVPGFSGIYLAPPRITKPGEEWMLKQVVSAEPDGYLARNFDHLATLAGARIVTDFSFNVANAAAAGHFIENHGVERVCASCDLNSVQMEALLASAPPAWFEIIIHQRVAMFHMEHCVFCAFLSKGTDYTNCGRPCDRHAVRLRDRVGAEHPVRVDAGCRNTVFNALAQTGAEYAARFIALGARVFRVEFVQEPPAMVARTLERYQALLRGEITGAEVWRELKLRHRLGVTRGPMERAEAI